MPSFSKETWASKNLVIQAHDLTLAEDDYPTLIPGFWKKHSGRTLTPDAFTEMLGMDTSVTFMPGSYVVLKSSISLVVATMKLESIIKMRVPV